MDISNDRPMPIERWGWYSIGINLVLVAVHAAIAAASGSLAVAAELMHNLTDRSVVTLRMQNGTSQSPFCPRLSRQPIVPRPPCVRAASPHPRKLGAGYAALPQMARRRVGCALHMPSAGYGTFGPFATPAIRTRLRLPGTTRLALRASLAGSGRGPEPRIQCS